MRKKTNKLSIYLIKEDYSEPKDILKNADNLGSEDISINGQKVGTLYYGDSHFSEPSWIKKFFGPSFNNTLLGEEGENRSKLFNASSKALFLTEVEIEGGSKRIFALSFGYGWTMLNEGAYEGRFGLRTTLNVVDPNKLRRIDKKSMTTAPRDTTEQLSKAGIAADFGINVEQDLIRAVSGESKIERFGKRVSGKDSFSVSVGVALNNIEEFLRECHKQFVSEEYKKDFGWIDQISEIRDRKIIDDLNSKLIQKIKEKNFENLWMAVPEIVEWHSLEGFSYNGKKMDLKEDIDIASFLDSLSEEEKASIGLDLLKAKHISAFESTSDEQKYNWKAFRCLYCEMEYKATKKTCLLSNGSWYEIETDFVNEINNEFELTIKDSTLPEYDHENENDYNVKVAASNDDYYCMDRQNIRIGRAISPIEFCDLFDKNKKIIHVKKYGNSSVLSHLFFQGVVSGELFLAEKTFRQKVANILPDSHKIFEVDKRPTPAEYEVIFAVISSKRKKFNLPFFSKVSLRSAKRRLETFGYKSISLVKIPNKKT